ncbi:glycosyltransferase family 2 protein [Echinicola salinicaeni]|uniref:glycosyltransferase family 2 protein n=1 Tax=Echinicola salinicaeni TaxID=2762757 RepID=UPI001647E0B7|nr:glycosyltransferase family A protein [Echinicola salinicaeni]
MFSVIIPLYNKAPYICRAIDSVLQQSHMGFEVIVINDGSTDGGDRLVEKRYGNQVHLIHQANQGVSAARNRGISEAQGAYIAFLDADDFWHMDFLTCMEKVIEKYPDAGILGSTYITEGELKGERLISPEIRILDNYFQTASYNTWYTSSSTVIKKDFFTYNQGFKPHLTKGEDLDVWFRAIAFYGKGYYVNHALMHYDQQASQTQENFSCIERTIFAEMVEEDYPSKAMSSYGAWLDFRVKFLALNLLPYYGISHNKEGIKRIWGAVSMPFTFLLWVYYLPFNSLQKFVGSNILRKWHRKYSKFCIRYIYP